MKIIRKSIMLLLYIAITISLFAQQPSIDNSVLWKIEGNGLEKASYLMGTIHIMCEDDFEIKNKIIKALSSCDDLVLEVNFSDPKQIALIQETMMSDEKLSETLSPTQVSTLDDILKEKMNAGIEAYDQFSLTALYSLILTQSVSCSSSKYWEMELIALAKAEEKTIYGLESIEGQVDFFVNAFPPDEIIKQLGLMGEYSDVFDTMMELYKCENISKLGEVVNDPRFMDDNARYWMLEYRNKDWLKKMQKLMKKRSNFFAVGSAHLVGELGLILQLRQLGYSVTPILD